MIDGPIFWKENLAAQQKRALYTFEIPDLGIIVTSFLPFDVLCPGDVDAGGGFLGGWGIFDWGIELWGSG